MGNTAAAPRRTEPKINPSKHGIIMAFIIGNSEYNPISKLKNLEQPKNDAQEFNDVCEDYLQIEADDIYLMIDEDKQEINETFELEILRTAKYKSSNKEDDRRTKKDS